MDSVRGERDGQRQINREREVFVVGQTHIFVIFLRLSPTGSTFSLIHAIPQRR